MTIDPDPEPDVRLVRGETVVKEQRDLVSVVMSEDARDAIDDHVARDTTRESGGILAGTYDEHSHRVRVIAAIPATLAVGAVSSLTFTHEAWDEVNERLATDHPDLRMVGWYHSHPHFGIFLSEYDLFIHQNFFSEPWQVAYVVDPLLGQAGYFGWSAGAIQQHGSWLVRAKRSARTAPPTQPQPDEPPKPPTEQGWSRARLSVVALAAIVVAFVVGLLVHGTPKAQATSATTSFSFGSLRGTRTTSVDGPAGRVVVSITNTARATSSAAIVDGCAPGALSAAAPPGRYAAPTVQDGSYRCSVPPLRPGATTSFTFSGRGESVLQASGGPPPSLRYRQLDHQLST